MNEAYCVTRTERVVNDKNTGEVYTIWLERVKSSFVGEYLFDMLFEIRKGWLVKGGVPIIIYRYEIERLEELLEDTVWKLKRNEEELIRDRVIVSGIDMEMGEDEYIVYYIESI